MASYTHREVITRRVEYAIATGDAIGEFLKAYADARLDYCRRHRLDPDTAALPDHWAWIHAHDDEIVLTFDLDTADRAAGSEPGS